MTLTVFLVVGLMLLVSSLHTSRANNIPRGTALTAGTNSSWQSTNGDFAFGFYNIDGNGFLIGIWFDKIQPKTLIWSANRDNPAPVGSTVELTKGGLLIATHKNGETYPIYTARAAKAATFAVMQDDGNLVLKDSSSLVLWQSFSSPTDTILPGQVLVPGQEIFSNGIGTNNYSTGIYRLQMQQDGNLVLSAYLFADNGYWYSGTVTTPNVSLVFNSSGMLYLLNRTDIIRDFTTNMSMLIGDYYHRATIDNYGNFGQFVHPKGVGGSQWTRVWKFAATPCAVNNVCGVYGYCTTPDNETVNCECLPGFIPLDPKFPRQGCYQEVAPEQQCGVSPPAEGYHIVVLNDSDILNGGFTDMALIEPADVDSCGQAVLDDCYCVAATLQQSKCYKKRTPFYTARKNLPYSNGIRIIIKVANQANHSKNSKYLVIAGLITSSVLGLFFIAIFIYYNHVFRLYRQKDKSKFASVLDYNLREFTFEEVRDATNGFSDKLGQGSFGTVYRGALISEDKTIEIAVKQLEKAIGQGEKEFITELKVISRTHHKNLVRLLGFCEMDDQRILVYELMKNGSLSEFLFKEGEKPSWDLRTEIALGIANGLLYLHEECNNPIIHCDIKPQNVLLGTNYTAKISDFGLAKLLMVGGTRTSTNVRGTMGYLAPEWLKNVPITFKVDVYSFGVMLLEIICCTKHTVLHQTEEDSEEAEVVLREWVLMCTRAEKLERVIIHDSEAMANFKMFERMVFVGLWCIHPDPVLRPSMKIVMQMLEGVVEVGEPPLILAPYLY